MEKNTSKNIINAFLYLLALILIGIIVYLLLLAYQGKLAQDAFDNANPPRLSGEGTDVPSGQDGVEANETDLINGQLTNIDEWLTWESSLAPFQFGYPPIWTVEENVEADFITLRNEKGINMINIRLINKPTNSAQLDFQTYASQAAGNEIQGYQSLADFYQIVTLDDILAYQATWNVQFLGGEEFISPPITYFQHPFDDGKSIQFVLENNDFKFIYDIINESFQYT